MDASSNKWWGGLREGEDNKLLLKFKLRLSWSITKLN